jgi:hypothetical protein
MTPVWILVGCVAVIGVVLVLYKRGAAKAVKAEDAASAAKQ